jgi:hypothetical protein
MFRASKLKWLISIARLSHRIAPFYHPGYARTFLHAIRRCRSGKFHPVEAFQLGLFDPHLPPEDSANYVGRSKFWRLIPALNPPSWTALTDDKGLFYRHCMAVGVPVPTLYAIFFPDAAGWSYNQAPLASREDWAAFFIAHLPAEFFTKPAAGSYSRGVNAFRRDGEQFIDAAGVPYTAERLYDALCNVSQDGVVIQQRLRNHPELVRLSGTESLQTVRMITLLDADGSCRILHAYFKCIAGGHLADTYVDTSADGLVGNLQATVGLADGRLESARQRSDGSRRMRVFRAHPETHVSFVGFKLPFWDRACEMVCQSAVKLSPLRTFGWDVALTPEGPVVVEANSYYVPPNRQGCAGRVYETLSAAAQWWSPSRKKSNALPSSSARAA